MILNRPVTIFFNTDDANAATTKLRQTKTILVSFIMTNILLYETKVTGAIKI